MKHHHHQQRIAARDLKLNRRAEAAWDFIVAVAIGFGLAWVLVKWWSS
jgi:hypothetical protein